MSLLFSFFIIAFLCETPNVSRSDMFLAMAIVVAGGLAGLGGKS